MPASPLLSQYLDALLAGNRQRCRDVFRGCLKSGGRAETVYQQLIWPAMEEIEKLYRSDSINLATEHMATRINRTLSDQLQASLEPTISNGKRVLMTSAAGEAEEMGAQMCADLFEARGWDVYFVGSGIPNDELLALVGQLRPDILLIFGTQPQGVPQVRALIDLIRDVGANPTMNVMTVAGVFNRADGLWKEINADLFARDIPNAIAVAEQAEPRKPEIRIPGAPKKRRRRRRPAVAHAEA